MSDVNGDESLKWNSAHSQWDESWIPFDAYMYYGEKDRGEKHLCDDEIALLLQRIRRKIGKKGTLTVVVDACHSGDATCGDDDEYIRGVDVKFCIPKDIHTKSVEPIEEEWRTISAEGKTHRDFRNMGWFQNGRYGISPKFWMKRWQR